MRCSEFPLRHNVRLQYLSVSQLPGGKLLFEYNQCRSLDDLVLDCSVESSVYSVWFEMFADSCLSTSVLQVVGSESGGIYTTPLHFRNSGVVEVIELLTK